jgi:hypothetical protein
MCRTTRAEKDGPLIGGYILTGGGRCDANVKTRSLVQLDIDTKIDKATSEILKRAPPFADGKWLGSIRRRLATLQDAAPARRNAASRSCWIAYQKKNMSLCQTLTTAGRFLDRDAGHGRKHFTCQLPLSVWGAFTIHNVGALPVDTSEQAADYRHTPVNRRSFDGLRGQRGRHRAPPPGLRHRPETRKKSPACNRY